MSGALIAPIVAHELNKPIVLVRKPKEDNHSGYPVEGVEFKTYIIIDDFIETGATIRSIILALNTASSFKYNNPELKAVFTYAGTKQSNKRKSITINKHGYTVYSKIREENL
jgi:phosphoribosylpyrophosphate synthetase